MNNNSEEITANEINKFSYCPYQFYYERVYGQKYIKEVRKEMLEELGYTDSSKSNLKRGLDYHKNYKTNEGKNYPIFNLMILVILIVIGIAFYEYVLLFFNSVFNIFSNM